MWMCFLCNQIVQIYQHCFVYAFKEICWLSDAHVLISPIFLSFFPLSNPSVVGDVGISLFAGKKTNNSLGKLVFLSKLEESTENRAGGLDVGSSSLGGHCVVI